VSIPGNNRFSRLTWNGGGLRIGVEVLMTNVVAIGSERTRSLPRSSALPWNGLAGRYLAAISAGAYLIGRVAARQDRVTHGDLTRIGEFVAMASFVPVVALHLSEHDGNVSRLSPAAAPPISWEIWLSVLYVPHIGFDLLRRFLNRRGRHHRHNVLRRLINQPLVLAIHDAAGLAMGLMIATCWQRCLGRKTSAKSLDNGLLLPLVGFNAVGGGAEVLSVALDVFSDAGNEPSQRLLMNIDSAAHIGEHLCMAGLTHLGGNPKRSLQHGKAQSAHRLSKAGSVAAEVLKRLPVDDALRRPVRMAAAALGLAAGLAMRLSLALAEESAWRPSGRTND
jgi:hypothetical protein